ncbi:hypothetical protein BALAC2494_02049 [Bifidobacterium animalis subsp. lactis CNCM I-2494]|uniref:Uncharacterized protein n=1 Tax=Bifidobacterium animalis subsp. lactis CNCM I-2494 TaxID=1042403 RepID=A0A806FPR3_BIFAN|nr:hypothetical protein BALAC2494_02049 [Bifidobacterium animalis subsp. lactis CNCM I-2494]
MPVVGDLLFGHGVLLSVVVRVLFGVCVEVGLPVAYGACVLDAAGS